MEFLKKLFGLLSSSSKEEPVWTELKPNCFFGIDLLSSPDNSWYEDEDEREYDSKGKLVRHYYIEGLDYETWFFPRCHAIVTGDKETIFIFTRKTPVDKALDFLYAMNKKLRYGNDYEYERCRNTYRNRLCYQLTITDWDWNGMKIEYEREPDDGDSIIKIHSPYYNKAFLDSANELGNIEKEYENSYEISYIDGQDKHQSRTIKNANMNSFIAGIKYRDNYEDLLAKLKEGMELRIKPEPDNKFDPKALAVYNCEDHLGYIPKRDIPAVVLNMENDCCVAVIDYVDEGQIDLVIPVTFNKLSAMSDKELEEFSFFKTERTKYEKGYIESSSPISKEEFLEGIRQQRENLK